MIFGGVDFRRVSNASGARGFYGEGYSFHRFLKPLGLDYAGATFTAKTVTWAPRDGNMPLASSLQPKDFKPSCIVVKLRKGVVLNAVGLSNPGIVGMCYLWHRQRGYGSVGSPWMISIAAVGTEPGERAHEIRMIAATLQTAQLQEPYAIQLNLSCPNTGHDQEELLHEAEGFYADIRSRVRNPVLFKLNMLVKPDIALRLPGEGFVVSNTLPWGTPGVDWRGLFGSEISPLAHLGGGGLSGKPLLPMVCEWIKRARDAGITRPIIGGGGILSKRDADRVLASGASAIELGSVSILRPWRVAGIIKHVNRIHGGSDGRRFDHYSFT